MNAVRNFPNFLDRLLNSRDTGLHVKPVCHRLYQGINLSGTVLQQRANPQHWKGKVIIAVAKGIIASGYVLNTIIAAVESLVAFIFVGIAVSLHALTRGRSLLIKKITLKMFAYYVNTILVAGTQVICLNKGIFSRYHALNAIGNQTVYGVAILVAQFFGYGFDRWTGRNQIWSDADRNVPDNEARILRIFYKEIVPPVVSSTTRGIARDIAAHLRNNHNNSAIQAFIDENPNYDEIINRFNFERLRDDQYRIEALHLIRTYLEQTRILPLLPISYNDFVAIVERAINNDIANQFQLIAISDKEKENSYQDSLKDLIKKSFIELHDNPNLVRMFSNQNGDVSTIESGRDELLAYSDSAIIHFSNYAQLKELQSKIPCPDTSEEKNLQKNNNRSRLMSHARSRLKQLSEDETKILLKKLLRTGNFEIKDQRLSQERIILIQTLFQDIGTLAGQLRQGKLLYLYQEACQEASQAIDSR